MAATDTIRGEAWEDGGATCLARVWDNDATAITQSDLTSIARKVFDLNSDTPDTAVNTATLVVASTIFNTLQTDAIWTEDATGYNFKDAIPASVFATGGHVYRVEYLFTPVTGQAFFVVAEIHAKAVRSS